MSEHMQIGEVARRIELSVRTVRHWDEVGLVTPSARSAGGFRLYTDDDVARLLLVRRMKPLEFTLAEMAEVLAASDTLTAGTGDLEAAAAVITAFRERADERCETLRKRLAYAEEFTELLARLESR
ncbi:MerR family transcriptional regulator [Rhodococcoides corynebacterioides]|uniref:MerR family transcriptional regulator n=1 Tax=Rhodococcoides corynebacterioides TaxID=53972 RepID=UPI0008378C2D|nr:MerR family transcriptional regulator [Rhodococcus corynebacterioides]MBY6348936.1 MerR family transcriptional regulator [Rhodococcus corynebacterioides]MBY6361673.1 MerR family transcriptional regulator [Rhodococcus corynebacterioides]